MSKKQLLTYLVVGGTSYVIEIGSLYVLNSVIGLSSLASVAISFWIGFVVAFVLQKLITFKNHERTRKAVARQLVMYAILAGWNYLFTLILVAIFSHAASVLILRTCAIAIITVWNYALYRTVIFKDSSKVLES